jgi:signal transduction histidine kinase
MTTAGARRTEPEQEQDRAAPDHSTSELERGRRITRGLVDAGVALSSALSLEEILQHLANVARELVGARYAALGVVNPEKTGLSEFITSGLTPEQRARMGDLPTGHGILGLLIRDARSIRLRDLREHPASAGVPRHHPAMRSFLGVPVGSKGQVFGNLYVTEKIDAEEFDDEDLAILEMLASQAAVAIDNAQLRRERDRFFAAASHELGNSIGAVLLWARRLLRQPPADPERWIEGVGQIAESATGASHLIEDLLSLSRIREGRLALDPAPIDLGALVRGAIEQHQPKAEAAGLSITLHHFSGYFTVRADAARVRQILANLLGNAIKFTPSGGAIEVGIDPMADGIIATWVRDTGPGIALEDQERIFLPYEQVAGVARGMGVGLGLSLSRQLAHLMGGDLLVQSRPGAGATFHLRLPAEAAPAQATDTESQGTPAGYQR